ncbi:hypothetical protein [Halopiger aswanensis]|uniref:DUF8054 domain-containing protein n=1 Tax=Halopiger aswanensis TaxID=148449 RepID=A0A3R7EF45_9EURY|nr:hypothetical protein [Halopiger aswanensis]RKD95305.1 hypothetical protein ATJ93_2157 [Halopiger aswanensis]
MNSTGTSRLESLRRRSTGAGERGAAFAFVGGGQDGDGGEGSDRAVDPETSSRAETLLRSIGLVATPPGSTPLRLESAFETAWRERLREIRTQDAQREVLAARLGTAPGRVTLAVTGDGFVATRGDGRVGCWPSNAAFLADLAAAETLDERRPDWQSLEPDEQGIVLTALRLFLDRCPNCDGALVGADAGTGTATAAELERPSATGTARTGADRGVSLECAYCGVMVIRAPYE